MLLLQVMMVAKFKDKKANFVNIKISFMLLLQMNMVAIFKMRNKISDSWDNINVTLASDDGRHIQAQL